MFGACHHCPVWDSAARTTNASPAMRTLQSCMRGERPDESTYVDVDSGDEQDMGQGKDDEEVKEEKSEEKSSEEDEAEEEEDDDVGLVLFGVPRVTEDESHYITTHEIQLSELSDHEGDSDVSVGWEDNQVYSFVDYDTFEDNGNKVVNEKPSSPRVSSSQPQPQPQQQICLSIRTTSSSGGDNLVYHGDVSRYLFRGVDRDAAKCFIAAPGRVHFGAKLRGKEVTDSSGTSSAVSELDDADKEVRNLTAKAFKSLAYPYAINFSTSSESSASEKWSAFVDLQYGNVDKRVVSHQNLENRGFSGFTLNGNPPKQLGFMGKLGQGHSGVIRLTETLNFRCNVGVAGAERPPMFAQSATAAGSRSKDEVTNAVAGGRRWRLGATTKPPCQRTMEGTHKKAIFASSVIKNVISKKMQFEQERKMERGEIREPTVQEETSRTNKAGRELVRQSSKYSESGSDLAIMCVDDLGDLVDSGSCDTKSDKTHRRDSLTQETNLEQTNEAGIDTKKGAMEASKSTLLRSQNSAFRCWKDDELEFQKDHKSAQETASAAKDLDQSNVKLTKMSSLFVPSVQLLSSEEQQQQDSPGMGDEGRVKKCPDHTLFVVDSRSVTTRSPEIKINLRSGKNEPFGVSRLRAPNIGCSRTEDYKTLALAAALKGECSDKVPHFMVRDIRDNKGKLQTPIHQVRDVRKLVKSSYHFVSLDNNENKNTDSQTESKKQTPCRNSTSVSPIVIKCQSVNTNNGKVTENVTDLSQGDDLERSSPEGAQGNPLRAAGKAATLSEGLKIESKTASWKQDKDSLDKNTDKMSNQVALEKLQAAVKTMEQLYVFEKNEWKRKNEPNPMTDSHVLSLITNADQDKGFAKECSGEKVDSRVRREDRDHMGYTSSSHDDRLLMKSMKAEASKTPQPTPYCTKTITSKSPMLPTSMRSTPGRLSAQDRAESKEEDRFTQEQFPSDHENYLTIPVKSTCKKAPLPDKTSAYTFPSRTPPGPARTASRDNPAASVVMETSEMPSAAIYHSLPMGLTNQVYCFSPAMTPAPTLDPFQPTQRKMLLDPTTGNYYLVETPVQPTSKRLFDPETGQYVDVPLPPPPMTPVPMSPLALSPAGAYAHTYMIYPGFMPPTVIPARTLVSSQMSMHSEPPDKAPPQQSEAVYMESPYYMATGKSPQAARPSASRTPLGYSGAKPFISITSPQQGPRIIAPPSFDGTTMSFVVEHR